MRLESNRNCYRVSLLPTLGHFEVEPSGSRLLNMFSPKQIRSQVRRLDAKNWGFSTFRTFFRPDSTFSAGLAVKGSSFFPFILSVTYFFGFKNRSKTCPASILPVFNDHQPIWSLILPLASFYPSKNPSQTFPRVVFRNFRCFCSGFRSDFVLTFSLLGSRLAALPSLGEEDKMADSVLNMLLSMILTYLF